MADADPLWVYRNAAPGKGGMAPFQRRFHESRARKRMLLAANRVGKTYGGAAEAWDKAGGRDGFLVPSLGWILCSDLQSGWAAVSRCLRSLEPPDCLDPRCQYTEEDGYTVAGRRMVKLASGSLMVGKGSDQKVLALESDEVDWAWVDEPPKRTHFSALRTRLQASMGPLWVTLTPIGRPVDWLRELVEGNPGEGVPVLEDDWWVEHVEVTAENAPHRTPESIETQRAECDAWEYNQRILAGWDGVSVGRKLAAFSDALVFGDELFDEEYDSYRLGIDHGEGDGKEVAYLEGIQGRRVTLLREYASTSEGGFLPRDHARGILAMLRSVGLTLFAISEAHGDTNSAGMMASGVRYNTLLEDAFARELKLSRCPVSIQPAQKRKGAPRASISALNAWCAEGRWRVHESCTKFQHAARHFTGREKDLKDAIDAARYGVMDMLLSPEPAGASLKLNW